MHIIHLPEDEPGIHFLSWCNRNVL